MVRFYDFFRKPVNQRCPPLYVEMIPYVRVTYLSTMYNVVKVFFISAKLYNVEANY